MITPKGKEDRVDIECLDFKRGMETSPAKFSKEQSHQRHRDGALYYFPEEWTTLEGDLRHAFVFEDMWRGSEKDLNVEGPP